MISLIGVLSTASSEVMRISKTKLAVKPSLGKIKSARYEFVWKDKGWTLEVWENVI